MRSRDYLVLKRSYGVLINCSMTRFYVPYQGEEPAAVFVKGHRVVILSHDAKAFSDSLDQVGADRVVQLKSGNSAAEQRALLDGLAKKVKGPVVVMPSNVGVGDVLKDLENQLPWLN